MIMWNPWHGCHKKSEGCKNCYMFSFDKERGIDSNIFFITKDFDLPLKKLRNKEYKIASGEEVMICLTSDFFIEEADKYREKVWEIVKTREDLTFTVITKRIERVEKCLPKDFSDNYKNFFICVTVENQKRADERLPILINLNLNYRAITLSPMLEKMDIRKYLATGKIHKVSVAGENYKNARPLNFDWVKDIYNQCKLYDVEFEFYDTGSNFIKDNKKYFVPHRLGREQAKKAMKYLT